MLPFRDDNSQQIILIRFHKHVTKNQGYGKVKTQYTHFLFLLSLRFLFLLIVSAYFFFFSTRNPLLQCLVGRIYPYYPSLSIVMLSEGVKTGLEVITPFPLGSTTHWQVYITRDDGTRFRKSDPQAHLKVMMTLQPSTGSSIRNDP